MKRFFDFVVAGSILITLLIPMLGIFLLVRVTSNGPAFYWSKRIGKNNNIFNMPKFRTMRNNTPPVATHLISNAEVFLTPIGGFLRRTSLDELPQLFSILNGDMSFVGPRPALFNQDDLIALRTENGLDQLMPGLTGWAQVNGRDDLSISEKVELDLEYMKRCSYWFDMKILWMTFLKVFSKAGVSH